MKKKHKFALILVSTIISCNSNVFASSNDFLPFGFSVDEFVEDFSNFGSYENIIITDMSDTPVASTYYMNAENKEGVSIQFIILADSEDHVLNIGISKIEDYTENENEPSSYTDILITALKATDMHLDPERIIRDLNVEDESKNRIADGSITYKSISNSGILVDLCNGRMNIKRDAENADDYNYIEIISNSSNESDNYTDNVDSSTSITEIFITFGELIDVNTKGGINMDELIIKAKIEPSLTNNMTIKQNYLNIEDIIQNQDGDKFNGIQYWAVADMTDGTESKVISFSLSKDLINSIANGYVTANNMDEYLTDLYIHPSLKE